MVEKVLDLFMLGLTIAILMPFVILPDFVGDPGPMLWLIPVFALAALYVVAFQTEVLTSLLQKIARMDAARLDTASVSVGYFGPGRIGSAAQRSNIHAAWCLLSALIAFLAVLLPYVLFAAFDFQLTLVQAALINVVVIIVTTPPSTPGKIGVFNGVVAIVLYRFGTAMTPLLLDIPLSFIWLLSCPSYCWAALRLPKRIGTGRAPRSRARCLS